MADKQALPDALRPSSRYAVEYNLVSGPMRCVLRLASGAPGAAVKAVWRNEVGVAPVTGPRRVQP